MTMSSSSLIGFGLKPKNQMALNQIKNKLPTPMPTLPELGATLADSMSGVTLQSGTAAPNPFSVPDAQDPMAGTFDDDASVLSMGSFGGGLSVGGTSMASGSTNFSKKTQWLTHATKVLRFYGFTTESIQNSNLESERVRRVTILYYLEDDSVKVFEPKIENSGLVGGTVVKRGKHTNTKADPPRDFIPEDFFIGSDVLVNGRMYHICDCDQFTRDNMPDMEMPEEVPSDKFTKSREFRVPTGELISPRVEEAADLMRPRAPDEPDVLEYTAVWEDTSEYGSTKQFKIVFYLEDGSVQLKIATGELKRGRQMFETTVSRQRVLRTVIGSGSLNKLGNNTGGLLASDEFLSIQDFKVGSEVNFQNRPLRLVGCNKATQEWWAARGFDFALTPEYVPPPAAQKARNPQMIEEQEMKAEKLNFFRRQAALATKTLRFAAKDVDGTYTLGIPRSFTVIYHLDDDSMTVIVNSPPNTGMPNGLFLKRMKHLNPETGDYFETGDMRIGSRVNLPTAQLEVIEMDVFTEKFLNGEFEGNSDVEAAFAKLKEKIQQSRYDIHDMFLVGDRDRDGVLTSQDFRALVDRVFGTGTLANNEIFELFRTFDRNDSGQISYNEFVETVLDEDAWNYVHHPSNEVMDPEGIDTYVNKLWSRQMDGKKEKAVERSMKQLTQFVYQMGDVKINEMFRYFDTDGSGTVSAEEFQHVLKERIFMNDNDIAIIMEKIYPRGPVYSPLPA